MVIESSLFCYKNRENADLDLKQMIMAQMPLAKYSYEPMLQAAAILL
jgi:hypothetical protein